MIFLRQLLFFTIRFNDWCYWSGGSCNLLGRSGLLFRRRDLRRFCRSQRLCRVARQSKRSQPGGIRVHGAGGSIMLRHGFAALGNSPLPFLETRLGGVVNLTGIFHQNRSLEGLARPFTRKPWNGGFASLALIWVARDRITRYLNTLYLHPRTAIFGAKTALRRLIPA
jgi:hypothetical protein